LTRVTPLKIVCAGGGPAGLYFAILMKNSRPEHRITVYERNRPDDTFGWGVVFSDRTIENLRGGDAPTQERIVGSFAHWDDIDVHFRGRVLSSSGHGFCGIARKQLLAILQERALELGVEVVFGHEVEDISPFGDADLIVAADGVNSRIRRACAADFGTQIDYRTNRFVWLGTHQTFDAFTFVFVDTPYGWFVAHAYRFDRDSSTFIVETREESWLAAGLDKADTAGTIAFCNEVFGPWLGGHSLLANDEHLRGKNWLRFPRVSNQKWVKDNLVLIGDAAHSAHFSIGSGTKLALEDAIALKNAFEREANVAAALHAYESERRIDVVRIQSAARNSTEWFEHMDRYAKLEPEQFAYSLLTRSQRVSHENLRLRDGAHVERLERWLAAPWLDGDAAQPAKSTPPMFLPFKLRQMRLSNRVVVSPMAMYSAEEGVPTDFHFVHFGARAMGGPGLIFTEMTCVTADGRITPGCAGLWTDEQAAAWASIVRFVHANSEAKVALQLGHAGPKGSTKPGWDGSDDPLDEGAWPLIAPSAVAWSERHQLPRVMSRDDMVAVRDAFVRATRLGERAKFDMLELHAAHGYLLAAFVSPILNRRSDDYGGSLENRLRFPLEVFAAMRAAWPEPKPMSVRISATDWIEGGTTPADSVRIARAFAAAGCDLIDVSAGQTSKLARPVYGRMFQTPFADAIRNEAGIATMAVGNITDYDQVNSIVAAGRADLVALARTHLSDPHFTLHAAASQGFDEQRWPKQYLAGKDQLERSAERAQTESAGSI
jgi:anthraniloyl-CoA monooxygenase